MVFPGRKWLSADPESQNIDAGKLNAAVAFLNESAGSNGVKRMVIVRYGRIIWRGAEADIRQRVWSVTKAFTSTAHGLLLEDGRCTMSTLAKDYRPELSGQYPTVTLRHLATMTSGIDGVGGSYDADPKGRKDANALVDPAPPFFAPGTKYMYWEEATQYYGAVLTKIEGEPLQDYLRRRILKPIGITRFDWNIDTTGKVPNWTGGTDSPENFLAYACFDNTPTSHAYTAHIEDWRPGDPDRGEKKGRGIIGALKYLASKHVNSIYFLTMNVGGDGRDVWPWIEVADPRGSPKNDNVHYDVHKLMQWETVFSHAQRNGIFLHFVFNEAESPNKRELDDGELGVERKLYYREIIARFSLTSIQLTCRGFIWRCASCGVQRCAPIYGLSFADLPA